MITARTLSAALMATLAATPSVADEGHPELGGATKAFHDLLSPDWHAEPGTTRNTSACRNASRYLTLSGQIASQPAPANGDAAAWTKAATGLHDASAALGAYCSGGIDANVVAGLTTLHDRFHDLMKAAQPARQ